jgi:hypothetical protein
VTASRTAELQCEEVRELAGVYVLGALEEWERQSVAAHLASCPEAHREIEDLGGVVPALASLVEPVSAPGTLKGRVMAAVAAEAGSAPAPVRPAGVVRPVPAARRFELRLPTLGAWLPRAAALAAVVLIVVLGAATVLTQSRAIEAEQRAALLADAIAAYTSPDAAVATLSGTGPAAGATGFAAFPVEGPGYLVLVGLPPAPTGRTYQAWYLVNGQPSSAGLLTVGSDGYAILSGVQPMPGADTIALTLEIAGGVDQPSGPPVVTGRLEA